MNDFLKKLFSPDGFMPHGHCYLWQKDVLGLHIASDALIALAYYSIPFTLVYFIRKRRDIPFNWIFLCFALFIIACGTTHLMEIFVIWHPVYWLSGSIKAITALVSVPTALLLMKLMPQALSLPSPSALKAANAELETQISERKRAEASVREWNDKLEQRVSERTQQLETTYQSLMREVQERQRAEQHALEKQKLLQAIIDNSTTVIYVKDPEGRYLLANRRFSELFHVPQDGMVGRTDFDFFPAEQAAAYRVMDRQAIAAKRAITVEEIAMHEDGPHTYISVKGPLLDDDGASFAVFGVSTDITEQKKAQEHVKWLASFPEQNPNPIIEMDVDTGMPCYQNPVARRLFPDIWVRGFEHPYVAELAMQAVKGDDEDSRLMRRDISIGSFHYAQTVSFFPEARRVRIYGVDITERTAAEEARARLAAIVNSSDDAIIGKTLNGIITSWNRAATRAFGYTAEEAIGKPLRMLIPPERHGEEDEILARISRGESVDHFETERVRKDGRRINIATTISAIRDRSGNIIGASKVARDITGRKHAEEVLRESEERYRTLFNTLIEGFCTIEVIFDTSGKAVDYRFLEINPAFEKQTGLRDAPGKSMRELAPEHEEHWFERYGKIALTGQPEHFESEARALGRYFDVCAYRIGRPEQRKVAILFNDITDRKRVEKEILLLNAELEQRVKNRTAELEAANKELEAFSYSVSHDLRAPLRAVSGFAGIVLEDYAENLPAEGKRYLERVISGGHKMGELIDDLLTFSRLSRVPLDRRRVDTAELVQEVLEELNLMGTDPQVELRIGELPVCECDPALLKQVWVNMLTNALKYSRGMKPAVVEIGSTRENGQTIYFVRDNGVGFDMQYAGKLFGVFQRLHGANEFEGTGVGLAIVQRIVHRHGGRVWAQAELNKGATFYFTMKEQAND